MIRSEIWIYIKKGRMEFSWVQFSHSVLSDSVTPWTAAHQASLSITISQGMLKLMSIESMMPFQPSHPLSTPSPTFNVSQHKGLFQWASSSHQVVKVFGVPASASILLMNIQDWFPLGWTGWISLQSKGLSKVLSNTTVQKHEFFSAQLSSQSSSHIHTWPLEKP